MIVMMPPERAKVGVCFPWSVMTLREKRINPLNEMNCGQQDAGVSAGNCPYVAMPFPDCYCRDITSIKIRPALYYCGGNFEQCEIYLEHKGLRTD